MTTFFMPITQDARIQQFIDYLRFEKRFSAHTARAYGDDLMQFREYLIQQYAVSEILAVQSLHIRSWMAALSEQQIKPRTINRKLSCIKSFFRFGRRAGLVSGSPANGIKVLKIPKRLPVYIEEHAIRTLLHHDVYKDGFEGLKERMIIAVFYHTGLRVSELVQLKIGSIDMSKSSLKVLGKGNKERVLPLQQKFKEEITAYIEERSLQPDLLDSDYLFQKKGGGAFSARKVYEIVRRNLGQVTTQDRKGPHVLRHSFATHLTQNGADLNAVKELLGHASLAATQVYTHHSLDKLRDIHRKAHPRG